MAELSAAAYHVQAFNQYQRLIDDKWMWAFTIAMILDLITGMIKPYYAHTTSQKTNSSKGIPGLIKHMVVYLVVAIVYPYLYTIGAQAMATTFLAAFTYQYAISVIENWTEMGWWLPKSVMDFFEAKLAKDQQDYNPADYNFLGKKKGGNKNG